MKYILIKSIKIEINVVVGSVNDAPFYVYIHVVFDGVAVDKTILPIIHKQIHTKTNCDICFFFNICVCCVLYFVLPYC